MTTQNQGLIPPAEGAADWDTTMNANLAVMDRGILLRATAGETINSGHAIIVNSDGLSWLHDPTSLDLAAPHGISYDVTSVGDEGYYVGYGVVRSMDIWSGHLGIGQPVFTAPGSKGFLVSSYPGANYPVGIAIGVDAIFVSPGMHSVVPARVTETYSFAAVVGSSYNFDMAIGHRGIIRNLGVVTDSCDAYKIQFWSGSARASSELLYETLTTSVDGGASDFDVSSLTFEDAALFPWENTDVTSMALVFGRVTVQSASAVGSSDFGITLVGEMLR